MVATQTARYPGNGASPSFETVWAALQEVAENQKETDRLIEKIGRKQEKTDQQIGKLGRRFGEVIEYMMAPDLCKKFREYGFVFERSNSGTVFSDVKNDLCFEVDVMLENGDKAMLVEVKSKYTTEDVKEHVKRLEKMRRYADLHGDKRTFLGASAGAVMTSYAKNYALKQGFYVIEPSGETVNITPPSGKPKEW
jgi:hypothetical protein